MWKKSSREAGEGTVRGIVPLRPSRDVSQPFLSPGTSRPVGQALLLLQQVRTLRLCFAALLEIS